MTEPKLSLQAWARAREKAPEMLALLRECDAWPAFHGRGTRPPTVEWMVAVDRLVAYILGEPTREEEEQHDGEGVNE